VIYYDVWVWYNLNRGDVMVTEIYRTKLSYNKELLKESFELLDKFKLPHSLLVATLSFCFGAFVTVGHFVFDSFHTLTWGIILIVCSIFIFLGELSSNRNAKKYAERFHEILKNRDTEVTFNLENIHFVSKWQGGTTDYYIMYSEVEKVVKNESLIVILYNNNTQYIHLELEKISDDARAKILELLEQ
jgi:hypothetical protein